MIYVCKSFLKCRHEVCLHLTGAHPPRIQTRIANLNTFSAFSLLRCLVFNLLAFLIAGVENRTQIARNFINDSPSDTDSTSYTAVYRCGRVFDSKSPPH